MPKLDPKNIENKVENTPKMTPKITKNDSQNPPRDPPGRVLKLGDLISLFWLPKWAPNGAQRDSQNYLK